MLINFLYILYIYSFSLLFQPARVLGAPPPKYDDAMRSSRPWSYFYPEEPALPPRRYIAEHHEDEQDQDLPPVPVPDYTLHFPSKRTYARKIQKTDKNNKIYLPIDLLD